MSSRIHRIMGLYTAALYADSLTDHHVDVTGVLTSRHQAALDHLVCATQHLITYGDMRGYHGSLWNAYTHARWRTRALATPSGVVATGLLRSHLGIACDPKATVFDDECLTDLLSRIIPLLCAYPESVAYEDVLPAVIMPATPRVYAAVQAFREPFQRLLSGDPDDEVSCSLFERMCRYRPESADTRLMEGAFWICLSHAELASACRYALHVERRLPGITMLTAMLCGARVGLRYTEMVTADLPESTMVYQLAHQLAVFSVHHTISSYVSA